MAGEDSDRWTVVEDGGEAGGFVGCEVLWAGAEPSGHFSHAQRLRSASRDREAGAPGLQVGAQIAALALEATLAQQEQQFGGVGDPGVPMLLQKLPVLVELAAASLALAPVKVFRTFGAGEHADRAPGQAGTAGDLPQRHAGLEELVDGVPAIAVTSVQTGHGFDAVGGSGRRGGGRDSLVRCFHRGYGLDVGCSEVLSGKSFQRWRSRLMAFSTWPARLCHRCHRSATCTASGTPSRAAWA